MLYTQSSLFQVIPKRAFTAEELIAFREALQRYLAAKSASYERKMSPTLVGLLIVFVIVAILLGIVLVRSKG